MSTTAIFWFCAEAVPRPSSAMVAPRIKVRLKFILLVITCKSDAKLELATAAHVVLVVIDRDTVVQSQWSESRNIETNTDPPVIRIIFEIVIVSFEHHITDVIEDGKF